MKTDVGLKKYLQTLKDIYQEEIIEIREMEKSTWTMVDEIKLTTAEGKLDLVKSIIKLCEIRGRY